METRIDEIHDCDECRFGLWIWGIYNYYRRENKDIYEEHNVYYCGHPDLEGGRFGLREVICPLSTKSQYIAQQIREALGDEW